MAGRAQVDGRPAESRRLLSIVAIGLLAGCAGTPPDNRSVHELSGVEMYQRLCASCHGVLGHGDGVVAPLIKSHVPDLTRIAQRDGGEFPTQDVRRTIDGRWDSAAHGARDMPVWGWQLYDASSGDAQGERATVDAMIGRLVDYLRSIQVE